MLQPGKRPAQSAAVTRTKASAKKKKGKSAKKSRAKSAPGAIEGGKPPREPDMLDEAAMNNLYYTAHSAANALEIRGFKWEGAPKKKKGKKSKKK